MLDFRADSQCFRSGDCRNFDFRPGRSYGVQSRTRYAPLVMAAGKYLTDALIKASSGR